MIRKIPMVALALCLHVPATLAQGAGRRVTTLGPGDSALAPIAAAAARSIEQRGSAPPSFAGVFVGSREVRDATDRVISVTKLARIGDTWLISRTTSIRNVNGCGE